MSTKSKPALASGTRDFGTLESARRNFIFDTLKQVFQLYGFRQIETPAMEQLATLTGKYGEEGDRLIFKILNSGDFLNKVSEADFQNAQENGSKPLISKISERALRYDLTVPMARFVAMNRNNLQFPFKRYQMQPVWRADRPQRGRYREFYQCDVDIVGSDSLIFEAELIEIYATALSRLGLEKFQIRVNNRKILSALSSWLGVDSGLSVSIIQTLDKLDKIGLDEVLKLISEMGVPSSSIEKLKNFLSLQGTPNEVLQQLDTLFAENELAQKGISELREVLTYLPENDLVINASLVIDPTLARGLDYYTGTIFEVISNEVAMGSIGGGGRYDNLTEIFGLPDTTGVGVSFGAERIYDVLLELNRFPESIGREVTFMCAPMSEAALKVAVKLVSDLRKNNIAAEVHPAINKLKKQLAYANAMQIPFVGILGDAELQNNNITLKNFLNGEQTTVPFFDLPKTILNLLA